MLTTIISKIQESRIQFVPSKAFVRLLDTSPKKFIFLKTFDSQFSYIEECFKNQNSKPLEKEDKISITVVVN